MESEPNDVGESGRPCAWCRETIPCATPVVSVSHRIDLLGPDGKLTAVRNQALLTLCESCGERLPVETLRDLLLEPETG